MTGTRGIEFLLDLENATALRGGDALVLEDGRLIEVVAAPEPLLEIRGEDPLHLGRVAWASRQPSFADAYQGKGPAHPQGSRYRGDGEGTWRPHHRDRGAVRSRGRADAGQAHAGGRAGAVPGTIIRRTIGTVITTIMVRPSADDHAIMMSIATTIITITIIPRSWHHK